MLIDEIENGIHYSSQQDFWEVIFGLAEEFNVQLFATTHSLEMIKAFQAVTKKRSAGDFASYHGFFRHSKINEVSSNYHDVDTLSFELDNNMGIRG